ncbi:MAG: PQQ-dependent sugar dehydrogenase, partial [Acidobacteriota bacterium]|nr:PQQ-dependent sugar dehydrogenase [Acidobacteriota bacterium]
MRKTHLLFIAILSTLLLANSASMAQGVCDGVSPTNNLTIDSVVVATGLSQPLLVTAPPGDTDRIFIVQQHGVIQVKQRGTAANAHTTFLDIQTLINTSGNERGLLGMAFDPDYDINGYFYVNYTRSGSGATVVARFSVTVDPDVADPASVVSLLTFTQPQSNHNGGHLEFGTDGFLYIGTGDGGGANDAGTGHASCGNGLATDTMLGKILRIDPTPLPGDEGGDCGGGAALYGIPATNPLVDGAGGDCDEIFAWGLRNPWRFDFDGNGDLYIADVGQNCWEEVDYATPADADG